jgi:integrase
MKSFKDAAQVALANHQGIDPNFGARLEYFIEAFDQKDVTQVTGADIEIALDHLAARGKLKVQRTKNGLVYIKTGLPLSPATINRYLNSLGSMYKELRRLRVTPRGFISPTKGVERPQGGTARTLEVSLDDVKNLIAACRLSRNKKLAAITAMACTTGWRVGNLQALKWRDIDLKAGFADAQRTKNGTPHRCVLLPWVVAEVIRIKPKDASPDDLVFGKSQFGKTWKTALRLANLPDWTFHHCRHIAASILAQSGASVPVIMSALNQKSPSMALRYSHLNTATLRENLTRAWA